MFTASGRALVLVSICGLLFDDWPLAFVVLILLMAFEQERLQLDQDGLDPVGTGPAHVLVPGSTFLEHVLAKG